LSIPNSRNYLMISLREAALSPLGLTNSASMSFKESHQLVDALSAALDAKHPYTYGHSGRVADLAAALAARMGYDSESVELIHIAGHLHDIGKIGVPDTVLAKEGPLTPEEFETIMKHPGIGFDILTKIESLSGFAVAVRHHHERWDGRGYPDGLAGEAIPMASRILAVADSWDAMTSARSYRVRLSFDEALEQIRLGIRSQFDPDVAAAFIELHTIGL